MRNLALGAVGAGFLIVVALLVFDATRDDPDGPVEQVGENVDEAVNDAARTVEDATD